jgi:hypothetical protein
VTLFLCDNYGKKFEQENVREIFFQKSPTIKQLEFCKKKFLQLEFF